MLINHFPKMINTISLCEWFWFIMIQKAAAILNFPKQRNSNHRVGTAFVLIQL